MDAELLRAEAAVRADGDDLWAVLRLDDLLAPLGTVHRTGSHALGVMVERDLDATIAVPDLAAARPSIEAVRRALLFSGPVQHVSFRDETGASNSEPDTYPDGLYLNVHATSRLGETWGIDLWFVDDPGRQPDLRHVAELGPRLDGETRAAILAVKTGLVARGDYRRPGRHGLDVYRAVLDAGVRTLAAFDALSG